MLLLKKKINYVHMPMIEFRLKDPQLIESSSNVSWFWLTEGNYWIHLGEKTLFEAKNANGGIRHVQYQIARFVEDFLDVFEAVAEDVPDDLFQLVRNHDWLNNFIANVKMLLNKKRVDPSVSEQEFDEFYEVLDWISVRTVESIHLKDNPRFSVFKRSGTVSIFWSAEGKDCEWTAGIGQLELSYDEFIAEIEGFRNRFFAAMNEQIVTALEVDWKYIPFNKDRLIEEQQERLAEFNHKLDYLKNGVKNQTDWNRVRQLISEMQS